VCGRFTLTSSAEQLAEHFEVPVDQEFAPRYNIAPGQSVCVVRGAQRELAFPRWGLVPHWASEPGVGNRMINARSETVAEKPAFRDAFRRRRCLLPSDGFYEWAGRGAGKQPYYIRLRDEAPFGMAGLWESWQGASGEALETCTILTTEAAPSIEHLHARMPVILGRADFARWLDPELREPESLLPLLTPAANDRLHFHPVSPRVNQVRFDDAECLLAVPEAPRQESLL